ncbi:hypothetical protein MMC11_007800, partial [Xylographa trunciseda]|nr:hypothetical protein [Xylographa trunciseda]
MPVTIKPAEHNANTTAVNRAASLEEDLLKGACKREYGANCKEFLQSSFTDLNAKTPTCPTANGFVNSAITAYNQHHHLVIRPEDVWFAILTQLSLYINKHAEELRDKFVSHEGKKELEVKRTGNRHTIDFGEMSEEMGRMIDENILDEELRTWIIPDFTTTTPQDVVVASVILMGAMQKYFNYKFRLCCGLPSVTLLGEQSDWQKLLERLEKLKTLGEETTIWYDLLKPVLTRFVLSFTAPRSADVREFWNKIAHYEGGGSGPRYYSGWITAFCFWNDKGKLLYHSSSPFTPPIDTVEVPPGYASIPVKIDDNGHVFMSRMISGSVGIKYSSSGVKAADGQVGFDTLQP